MLERTSVLGAALERCKVFTTALAYFDKVLNQQGSLPIPTLFNLLFDITVDFTVSILFL